MITWEKWYLEKKPYAVKNATEKIFNKLREMQAVMNKIDEKIIEKWVRDLVIVKIFAGLRFQEAILKKGAEIMKTDYRLSTAEEESKGIDGYIGNIAVSIKPYTYKLKSELPEHIETKIITYKKLDDGIEVDYEGIF